MSIVIIATCVVAVLAVAVAVAKLNDLLQRPSAKSAAAMRADREQRLLSPHWHVLERHLERPVPEALGSLYADRDLLLARHVLRIGDTVISSIEPIDEQSLVDSREWLGHDVLPIANSDGDLLYLRPGRTEPDSVYITYHDGGDTRQIAADVAQFVEELRASARNAA